MPSIVNFDNRSVIEPGVRSRIIGGVTNPPVQDTFGVVTLIDTGSGAGFGGGSGINGQLYQNSDSVYSFDNITDTQRFLGGGKLYDIMNYFWNPAIGANGPQRLHIIRACTTTAGVATITFSLDASSVPEVVAVPPISGDLTITVTNGTAPVSSPIFVPSFIAAVAPFTSSMGIPTFTPPVVSSVSLAMPSIVAEATGQTYNVLVNNTLLIGTYVRQIGDNTDALIATAIRSAVNTYNGGASGYTASGSGTTIIINGAASGGSGYNGQTVTLIHVDNGATLVSGNMSGGSYGVPNNGDVYNITVGGTTIATFTKTSAESTPALLATALRTNINNGTGTYGYTATGSGNGVILTGTTAMGNSVNNYVVQIVNTSQNLVLTSTLTSGVTAFPQNGDLFKIYVGTPLSQSTLIATYTKVNGDNTQALIATAIKGVINSTTSSHGFSASGTGSSFSLTGSIAMGSTKNGNQVTMTWQGTGSTGSVGNALTGGVTAAPVDGVTYKLYVGSITAANLISSYVKISGDSTSTLVASAIRTSINNGTSVHGYTAGGSASVVNITGNGAMGDTKNGLPVYLALSSGTTFSTSMSNGVTAVPAIPQTFLDTLELYAKNEGLRGNGTTITNTSSQTVLSRGYGFRVSSGIINPDAFVITFYEGQYRGQDANSVEYETPEVSVKNYSICKSVEFTTKKQFLDWAINDFSFNKYFKLSDVQNSNTTTIYPSFLTNNTGWNLFTGGTEDYNALDIDSVLESITDMDNDFFLCDDFGVTPSSDPGTAGGNKGAQSVANTKILAYIKDTSTYTGKIMFIGGGQNKNEFDKPGTGDGSLQTAAYYDDELAVIVHSGIKAPLTVPSGGLPYRELSSLYHAAMVCGRTAGLQPQIPVTYKALRIKGLAHELSKSERERALRGGVLHNKFVPQMGWVVNQGINSLQQNDYLIYPSGASPEIQVMRIEHQLNKEIIINATPLFIGGNRNTVSPEDVKLFIEGLLQGRTATTQNDNLIISSQNIEVTLTGTDYYVRYCFIVNSPVNRLFATGVVLDPTVNL